MPDAPDTLAAPPRPWTTDRPTTSPFALPRGWLGRLAGRIMRWTNQQTDLLPLLDVRPGDRVLEVGYGPGGLIRLLAERTEAALVQGVDPSVAMRDQASAYNRAAVRAGRVDLRIGTADATGLAASSVDRIVSVNNVAIWPDLEAGLDEFRRILRPGGTVLIAWHGGSAPSRAARHLQLPEDALARIERAMADRFATVTRRKLTNLDVFLATR